MAKCPENGPGRNANEPEGEGTAEDREENRSMRFGSRRMISISDKESESSRIRHAVRKSKATISIGC